MPQRVPASCANENLQGSLSTDHLPLGHASIATTSIDSSQELARKIEAVMGMKRRVVAV